MTGYIDKFAAKHFDDFVDGVGKLKAAILGVDRGMGVALISAIDIDDACQARRVLGSRS